jgi:microcin C transport system permease protein
MLAYIIRRLLLIVPTLFGIMLLNFAFIQFAPGGPVEQVLAQIQGRAVSATQRVSSAGGETMAASGQGPGQGISTSGQSSRYRGARGLDPALIADLEKRFGFDKPAPERFFLMMKQFVLFDFGSSFFQDRRVVDLVLDKLPVSISLGLWATLLSYLVCIPLGIAKAVRDGSRFDLWTTTAIVVGNAIPAFLFAILLIVLFAGGSYVQWFPLRGLVSENWTTLPWPARIADYFWHMTLPLVALVVGGFASLTMLTKNSFLDQINMQYVVTARAKGLSERRVLYGHVFRNAMLIVIAGFPGALIGILFTSSLLIEIIFSLDGMGLLGYESVINRDYPIVFATTYFYSLLGLVMNLIGDLTYMLVDPRIDFESREV